MYKNRGFTLLELLVVIAIIGILSSVVMVSLNSARAKARDAQRLSDMHNIKVAIENYFIDNTVYPLCAGDTVCSSTGYTSADPIASLDVVPTYISTISNDPKNIDGEYGYYYARGYKKSGQGYTYTGLTSDYIIATRLENTNNATFSGWNNVYLNFIDGN